MKKAIYSLLVGTMMLASCSDYTEIQPKGMSLLNSAEELELLFNQDMELDLRDLQYIGGSSFYSYGDILGGFAVENKSLSTLRLGYFDDPGSIQRIEDLTTSDEYYSTCYSWVGTIANPVLTQLATASGTDAKKKQLKSEALALRAYAHYLILQKFAKAYNPSTAANDLRMLISQSTRKRKLSRSVMTWLLLTLTLLLRKADFPTLVLMPADSVK